MARITTPLTNTEIRAAKPAEKEYTLADGGGLYLLIKPIGSKIWRFSYYRPTDKKRTLISFGSLDSVTLSDARKKRDTFRALIASGIDPQHHQKQAQEAEINRQENTFIKVAARWLELKRSHGLAENTLRDHWRSLELHIFPSMGNLAITEVKPRSVIAALEILKARGNLETVRRLAQRINEIMDYAANVGMIEENRVTGVRKAFQTPIKKHQLTIRPEQLPELMSAISIASIERQTRLLIEWQLLTVTRPAEAAETRWEEINLTDKTWTIPAGRMKMRRNHVIPLCNQALAVLEVMKPISAHREHLFPSFKDPKKPMNSQSANAALKRMGYQGILVSHGLRAIFSTAANEEGFDANVIEAALAHIDVNEVRRAYNRSIYLEKRTLLMCWWGNFVEAAATGSNIANGLRGLRAIS